MKAIKGIYDGEKIKPLEKISAKKNTKVIITFLEEEGKDEDSSIREYTSNSQAFDFWNDDREDIYQDYSDQNKK